MKHFSSFACDTGLTLSSRALTETFEGLCTRWSSTNVDIHTLVRELWVKVDRYNSQKSRDSRELTIGLIKFIWELNEIVLMVALKMRWNIVAFDSVWFTNMLPRATRQDKNRSKAWGTRQMYPFYSHSHLISCCLEESVNPAYNVAANDGNCFFEEELPSSCSSSVRDTSHQTQAFLDGKWRMQVLP